MDNTEKNDSACTLEQMMPGEDMPSSAPPERNRTYEQRNALIAAEFAREGFRRERETARAERHELELAALIAAYIALTFIILLTDLPVWLLIPAALLPAAAGIVLRVGRDRLPLREAYRQCAGHIAVSAFFLLIELICIIS